MTFSHYLPGENLHQQDENTDGEQSPCYLRRHCSRAATPGRKVHDGLPVLFLYQNLCQLLFDSFMIYTSCGICKDTVRILAVSLVVGCIWFLDPKAKLPEDYWQPSYVTRSTCKQTHVSVEKPIDLLRLEMFTKSRSVKPSKL